MTAIEYIHKIIENKNSLKKLQKGLLIKIKSSKDKTINEYLDIFKNYIIDGDIYKEYKYNLVSENKDENPFLYFLIEIKEFLEKIDNDILNIEKDYKRNWKYFNKRSTSYVKKLKLQIKLDEIKNKKMVEESRLDDLSNGIFELDEIQGRAIYNTYINKYRSKRREVLEEILYDIYKHFFAYFYFQIESLLHIGYLLLKTKKNYLNWNEKFITVNKLPFGEKLDKEDYKKIFDLANHYKHQVAFDYLKLPKISFLNDKILNLIKKLKLNSEFDIFCWHVQTYESNIESTNNPLGLTGFE